MKRLFAALLLSIGLFVPAIAWAQSGSQPMFVANPNSGTAPLSVQFSSPYAQAYPQNFYQVLFGDGQSAPLQSAGVSHTYAAAGTYTATLQSAPDQCYGARQNHAACSQLTPTYVTLTTVSVTVSAGGATQPTPTSVTVVDCAQGYHVQQGTTNCVPNAQPKPTCRIVALQNSPGVGATVNISWASTNATGGTINTIGSVGPKGTQGVIPLAPATTYTGTFTGPGGTATCNITIAVISGGGYNVTGSIGDPGAIPDVGDGLFYVPTYDGTAPQNYTTPTSPTSLSGGGGPGGTLNTNNGLVSCGGTGDCNICTLSSTVQNILNFALGLSIPIAAGMFAYAGYLYFSNAESMDKRKRAKNIFRDTLIGFCIALMAWLAVQTILKALAPGYAGWNSFQCSNLARPGSTQGNSSNLYNVINGNVGAPQQAPLAPVTVYNYNGTAQSVVVCQAGSTYNQGSQNCEACTDDGFGGKTCEVTAPVSDTQVQNNGCPAGSELKGFSCEVCYGGGVADNGATIAPDYCEEVAPISPSNTDCSAGNIQQAASQGGFPLTAAQANTLACIAVPESACGRNTSTATTPSGQVTSATGMFQIVMGYNDTCHNLNIPVCTQAAQAANFQVSGDLNCSQHFRGGVPIDQIGQACKAAASNINCNASAAACLVQKNPTFSDWTADPRSSSQQRCVNSFNS